MAAMKTASPTPWLSAQKMLSTLPLHGRCLHSGYPCSDTVSFSLDIFVTFIFP